MGLIVHQGRHVSHPTEKAWVMLSREIMGGRLEEKRVRQNEVESKPSARALGSSQPTRELRKRQPLPREESPCQAQGPVSEHG